MEFPGEDDGFYFPNMLSNSYYAWHDHDMMATLLYQEDKPFQATGSDVKMIGKCPFRIISTPWERPLLCSIWKSRCFIIIFTHTHTHTGQTFTKRQPIFPSGNLTSAQKSVGSSQMISSSNSCGFNIPGFEGNYLTAWSIYIYKFIKCWSSSISPSIFFPLQTRL